MTEYFVDDQERVHITYCKADNIVERFLMSRNTCYKSEDALCFAWGFSDWAKQNLKGDWKYIEYASDIELIFSCKEDAVLFKLDWMTRNG